MINWHVMYDLSFIILLYNYYINTLLLFFIIEH